MTNYTKPIRIKYKGQEMWIREIDSIFYKANISPLWHFDGNGKLIVPEDSDSYAIVMLNGDIWRYGSKIGHESEIEYLDK